MKKRTISCSILLLIYFWNNYNFLFSNLYLDNLHTPTVIFSTVGAISYCYSLLTRIELHSTYSLHNPKEQIASLHLGNQNHTERITVVGVEEVKTVAAVRVECACNSIIVVESATIKPRIIAINEVDSITIPICGLK